MIDFWKGALSAKSLLEMDFGLWINAKSRISLFLLKYKRIIYEGYFKAFDWKETFLINEIHVGCQDPFKQQTVIPLFM